MIETLLFLIQTLRADRDIYLEERRKAITVGRQFQYQGYEEATSETIEHFEHWKELIEDELTNEQLAKGIDKYIRYIEVQRKRLMEQAREHNGMPYERFLSCKAARYISMRDYCYHLKSEIK